jgi:molybdate transport system substrate-binding protein
VHCPHADALTYNARMSAPRHRPRLPLPLSLTLAVISTIGGAMFAPSRAGAEALHIAVAANFRSAAEAVAGRFSATAGDKVIISAASTGVLAAQLRRGAPFDLLLAADQKRPQALVADGFAAGAARCYARGTLVLLGADRIEALADPHLSLAIANPVTAPYGAAAQAVLARNTFSAAAQRRVVRGANVAQAYQFYRSGAADLALVARSLAGREGIAIPADWHPPITQYAVVSARSDRAAQAQAFLDFLDTAAGRELLSERGYEPCP